jgi:hypothetical protein
MEIATQTEPMESERPLTSKEKELKRKREWAAKKRREQGVAPRVLKTEEEKTEKLKEVYKKKAVYNKKRRETMPEEKKAVELTLRRENWQNKEEEEKKAIYDKQYARRKELWSEERKEAERAKRRETYAKKKVKEVVAVAL